MNATFRISAMLPALLASACGQAEQAPVAEATMSAPSHVAIVTSEATDKAGPSSPPETAAELTSAQKAKACSLAIGELNGRDAKSMSVVSNDGSVVRIKYKRPDDGSVWTNECMFEGNKVIWRTVNAFGPGSGLGRWRTHPSDETITYSLNGSDIAIDIQY